MPQRLEQRLSRLLNAGQQSILQNALIGLEKETLRVAMDGHIAQTPHPVTLGSALTHSYITTDYSEALLEFITPPFTDVQETMQFLGDIHKFVYDRLDQELLWATSMPCVVGGDDSIQIARYGSSNIGTMKHIYRRGLGYRYGKVMQVIAGVHFNFSLADHFWPVFQEHEQNKQALQDFISSAYLGLIRNFQRYGWLILYLFGASPAVCKSFFAGMKTDLMEYDSSTYYNPYATSLRMSDIGYTNKSDKKSPLRVSYNHLNDYIKTLTEAIETPCPDYEKIGVKVNGEYRQLNANILQIENEYYNTMRPKQIPDPMEKPTLALKRRGVRYVELRSVDISPFHAIGVETSQLHFLESFLMFCLFHDSPPINSDERDEINHNQLTTAGQGRDPAIKLQYHGRQIPLKQWALELCDQMQGICEVLDLEEKGQPYSQALAQQQETIYDVERTPSARILSEMRQSGETFFHFAKRKSQDYLEYFKQQPLSAERLQLLSEEAEQSLQRQTEIEASDTQSFDDYLQRYFSQPTD